jgi:hypothetical protein
VKKFEGGVDIVLTTQSAVAAPVQVKRLAHLAGWIRRLTMPRNAPAQAFNTFRCYRIAVLKEMIKSAGDAPLVTADGWAANAELLFRATPFARRIEALPQEQRYDLRVRESRLQPIASALGIYRVGRNARRLLATGS